MLELASTLRRCISSAVTLMGGSGAASCCWRLLVLLLVIAIPNCFLTASRRRWVPGRRRTAPAVYAKCHSARSFSTRRISARARLWSARAPIPRLFQGLRRPNEGFLVEMPANQHGADRQAVDVAARDRERRMAAHVKWTGVLLHVEGGVDEELTRRVVPPHLDLA